MGGFGGYSKAVPRYEYRCRACGDTFERNRPMAESSAPCTCPQGHDDTVKLLSTVSVAGLAPAVARPRDRPTSAGDAAAEPAAASSRSGQPRRRAAVALAHCGRC